MDSESMLVDTSGFFALVNRRDSVHKAASRIFQQRAAAAVAVTTEHVLVETAALLRARGTPQMERDFFALVETTTRLRVIWTSFPLFSRTRDFFLKHQDKEWSFVDCASFVVMKEEGLRDALSTDRHFKQAGFVPLLKA